MAVTDQRVSSSPEPEPSSDQQGKMTLFEHLAELRKRLIIAIVAVVAGTVIAWFFYDPIVHFMTRPYRYVRPPSPLQGHHPGQPGDHRPARGLHHPAQGERLRRHRTGRRRSSSGSCGGSSPPACTRTRSATWCPSWPARSSSSSAGVTTAILVFPKALTWLIDVSGTGIVPLFSPSRYFTLYVSMCLIFGVVFMYPLVVVFLQLAGVVPSATWRRWRRPAIVVICLVAAVITPSSDPFSFLAMAVPMLVFYEASIVIGRALHK